MPTLPAFIDPLRVVLEPSPATTPDGPLAGLTLAVKDVIDVAGVPTGAGNPDFLAQAKPAAVHAPAVQRLVDQGACIVGKAHTDEFAYSLSGTNAHYGTPLNPAAPGRLPGGSSSGSASAVATGTARIALGTDTAGSVRVPASYCGVHGLRPTHGRVPVDGMLPLAPSFDTCGLFAADGELLERAGLALLGGQAQAGPPSCLVLATDLLALADRDVAAAVEQAARDLAAALGSELRLTEVTGGRTAAWLEAFRDRQQVEVWRAHGDWIETHHPRLGPGVAGRFAAARATPEERGRVAETAGSEVGAALEDVLGPGSVLVLPSSATTAPLPNLDADVRTDLRARTVRLTCLAGLAGAPAVSLPLAQAGRLPVGICLLGRSGDDEALLAAARISGATSS